MRPAWLLVLGLAGCGPQDDWIVCSLEERAAPLITTAEPPDFQAEIPSGAGAFYIWPWWEDGGKYFVQSWDCVDLAWWSPAGPNKVVQVFVDQTTCEHYESVYVEYHPCDSHEGFDAPLRDYDGDGLSGWAGDCDDEDPEVQACEQPGEAWEVDTGDSGWEPVDLLDGEVPGGCGCGGGGGSPAAAMGLALAFALGRRRRAR